MSRLLICTILIFAMINSFGGCSSDKHDVVIPNQDSDFSTMLPDIEQGETGRTLWGVWTAEFNLESQTATIIPNRELSTHFNITSLISAPTIHINSYNPSTQVVDVDITIKNPYPINGYDVRLIIFTDNIGHKLLNFDDWTALYDIAGGMPINPFKAYAKEVSMRKFSGGASLTENLKVFLPGSNPSVRFAVDGSYPGNCEEPYSIHDFSCGLLGWHIGDSTSAIVNVNDWQENTSSVSFLCFALSGSELIPFVNILGDRWDGIITNKNGAPPGIYNGYFIATSSNSGSLYLYDEVQIAVTGDNRPPVCHGIFTDPVSGIIKTGEYITITVEASDPEGDFLTYEWDIDWDGEISDFDVDFTGEIIADYQWSDQRFFNVACRITDDGIPPLDTICTRVLIQEGMSKSTFKVDHESENDPNFLYPDTLILGEKDGKPISHAVYMDVDDNYVYYCNTNTPDHSFGNYEIISYGPLNGSNYGVKIIGADNVIYVFWLEYDTSPYTPQYRVKMKTSTNNGMTFGSDVLVTITNDPNMFLDADMCIMQDMEHLGLIYLFTNSIGNTYAYLLLSEDGGMSWHYPSGGSGQFRDIGTGTAWDPQMAYSPGNAAIHVFWRDYRSTPFQYYYDWSFDNGDSWNTELKITNEGNIKCAAMAVADNGNGYFAWADDDSACANFCRSDFGDPPVLNPPVTIVTTGSANFNGIDLYVSTNGETVIAPVTYVLSGNYKNRYFLSYNSGDTFLMYYERPFGAPGVYDIDSYVLMSTLPDRYQVFNAWVDERTGALPFAHIFGDYVYIAEM